MKGKCEPTEIPRQNNSTTCMAHVYIMNEMLRKSYFCKWQPSIWFLLTNIGIFARVCMEMETFYMCLVLLETWFNAFSTKKGNKMKAKHLTQMSCDERRDWNFFWKYWKKTKNNGKNSSDGDDGVGGKVLNTNKCSIKWKENKFPDWCNDKDSIFVIAPISNVVMEYIEQQALAAK